jgi:general secretion pathway protein D
MKKFALLILLCVALWGCTTSMSKSYYLGTQEAFNKNWAAAIQHYEKAMLEDPANAYYRVAWVRARVAASNEHLNQARRLAAEGKKEEALAEYDTALSFDPGNRLILNEARRLMKAKPEEEEPAEPGKIEPPIRLDVSEEPMALKFPREVSLRSIFQAMAKYSNVNVIFDEGFRDKPFSIDLTDLQFEQAISTLCMATKNFHRVVDPKTVLIIPDTPQTRMKYDLTAVKTFYLKYIQAQEAQQWLLQMIRSPQKIPTITHNKALNAVTIKDTPQKLELAEKILKLWDKPQGEILVELEIMEVSRQRLRDLGLELDNYAVGVAYTEGVGEGGWANLGNIDLGNADNYSVSIPSAYLRFLETDVETKYIAQPQLRGVHGEKIDVMVGDEVPIPNTTFQPIAAGGVTSQPIVSYEYKPVGFEFHIIPTINSGDEVTLELDVKIKALAGSGFGDLPIISTREVKNILRLRDGETTLMMGLLKDVERTQLKGIPGIKDIPGIGRLFSYTEQEVQQSDVVMTITPYILQSIPMDAEDRDALFLPLEGISTGGARGSRMPRGMPTLPGMERDDMVDVFAEGEEEEEGEEDPESQSGANRITLSPPGFETGTGREFRVNVNLTARAEIQNMSVTMSFNAGVLKLKSINRGNVIQRLGENPSFLDNIDNASGTCVIGFTGSNMTSGFKGSGSLVTLIFESIASGESEIAVSGYSANSVRGRAVQFATGQSRVRIR